MKRAVIFLLVLLIAVAGLCYAADRAVRAQLAETLRQLQADKRVSLASWDYASFSRRLVLRDVEYSSPEDGLTFTARELQAAISLRAILHAAPQLDFLLSPQGYLTLLDDWQGTDVTLRQNLADGAKNDCAIASVAGSTLAVSVEQFKNLRNASADAAAILRGCAFRSLKLEKPAFTWQEGQMAPTQMEAGVLELEKADIRQDLIGRILLTDLSCHAGEDSLRLKETTLTELRPVTIWEVFKKSSPDTFWEALFADLVCGTLQIKDGKLEIAAPNDASSKPAYNFAMLEMTRGEKAGMLKQLVIDQVNLMLPPSAQLPTEIVVNFGRQELHDVLLAEAIAFLKSDSLPWVDELMGRDRPVGEKRSFQPFFSRHLVKDIRLTFNEVTVTADQVETLWNAEGDTQNAANTITDLVIPMSVMPFVHIGLKELRCKFTERQSLNNGIVTASGSLTADGLCDLDYNVEGQMAGMFSPMNTFRHLDMRLTDKGLMALTALNIAEEPAVARMTMESMAQMLAANLPNGETLLPAVKTFIATPGELKIGIDGDEWIPIQAENPLWLLQLVTRLQLEAVPGSPLEERVKAQREKAAQ